jgi:hypothetical protein
MNDTHIHAIVACDSRGRDFNSFPVIDDYGYINHIILRRGAKIKDIETELILRLDSIPRRDICVVYIVAGICELTQKIYHPGGQELDLQPSNNLLVNLLNCKQIVRATFPRCIVGIATIPTISLKQAIVYNIEKGKLRYSKFTEEEVNHKQTILNSSIKCINELILNENKQAQEIAGVGHYMLGNLFFHQNIEKLEIKKRGGKKIRRLRISGSALVDGIHANQDVALKWYRAVHTNFMKFYDWAEEKSPIHKYRVK